MAEDTSGVGPSSIKPVLIVPVVLITMVAGGALALVNAATVDLERVLRVPSVSERGLYAEYKLTTDVSFSEDGVQLLEQVKVRIIPYEKQGDRDSDRELRTVEFARLLRVERDTLFSTNESLWERVVGQD